MYLGRFQLGSRVPLSVRTRDGAFASAFPLTSPTVMVRLGGAVLVTRKMPVKDPETETGLFQDSLFLGSSFSTGQHQVSYHYTAGGLTQIDIDTFEVVAGGNANGPVNSLAWWERPEADYLIQQYEDGDLVQGRNPRLPNPEGAV